jgi:CheY-like chemotaxis protein
VTDLAPASTAASAQSQGPKPRYNLENAKVLLVEPNQHGLEILAQIFSGFGVRNPLRAANADEAMAIVKKTELDLIVCEAQLEGMDGYDLVHWLRRSKIEPNNFTSTIIISGHTQISKVQKARDCGANFIVAKPLTPKVMIDRVVWVARENRAFIECDTYLGPDRRFHSVGPPPNTEGRRADDLPLEVGNAVEPNMSQDDIDAMLQPKRKPK